MICETGQEYGVAMNLDVQCTPVDADLLAGQWKDLQARAPHRFFTSWLWIENWLRTLQPDARVPIAEIGRHIAALVLCLYPSRAFRFLPVTSLHCNLTGDPAKDQIWPEQNGILMDTRYSLHFLPAIACELRRDLADSDELPTQP